MSEIDVIEKLKGIVADELDVNLRRDQIDADIPLFEEGLGLDSIVFTELLTLVETAFGIEFEDEELSTETFKSLRTTASVILQKQAA